jgi:hypothetical protein
MRKVFCDVGNALSKMRKKAELSEGEFISAAQEGDNFRK